MMAQAEDWIRKIIRAEIDKGNRKKLLEKLDTVTENIYQGLPSGDYGRGDVRAVILEEIGSESHAARRRLDQPYGPFMVPEVTYFDATEAAEITGDASEGPGCFARLSAPGYLDCTEWSGPFDQYWKALRYVCELYEVDAHGYDRR